MSQPSQFRIHIIESLRFLIPWNILLVCGGALLGIVSVGIWATAGHSVTPIDWIEIASFSMGGGLLASLLWMWFELMYLQWRLWGLYFRGNGRRSTNTPGLLTRESWERRRRQVKRRDGATCRYCGQHAPVGHADHIIPLSRGGTDDLGNLAWACPKCNLSKGNRTWEEWRESNGA